MGFCAAQCYRGRYAAVVPPRPPGGVSGWWRGPDLAGTSLGTGGAGRPGSCSTEAYRSPALGRKRNAMADLIAIGYPDETTADAAADEARRLAQDLIIDRGDRAGQRRQLPGAHQPSPGWRRRDLGDVLGVPVRPAVLH